MPVLPPLPPRVFLVALQVIAPVLSNINSESNLHSSTIDLGKSSQLLLSPDLNTVEPCVVPCIRLSLLSPTTKIYPSVLESRHYIAPSVLDLKSIAPPAYDNYMHLIQTI